MTHHYVPDRWAASLPFPCRVLLWPGRRRGQPSGPRNVLIEDASGRRVVVPWRRLRRLAV